MNKGVLLYKKAKKIHGWFRIDNANDLDQAAGPTV